MRWWWIGLGLLAIAALGLGWHARRVASLADRLEARIAELSARGEPVELTAFARPAIPDARNAAVLVREAMAWFRENDPFEWAYVPFEEWGNEQWAAAEAWVDEAAPIFDLVERACARPDAHWDLDWAAGWDMKIDAISIASSLTTGLEHAVRVDLRRGRGASALGRVRALRRLAELLPNRMLITFLVRSTVKDRTAAAIGWVAAAEPAIVASARDEFDAWAAAEDRAGLMEGLRHERATALDLHRRWIDGTPPTPHALLGEEPGWRERLENAYDGSWFTRDRAYEDALRTLDAYDEALAALAAPPAEAERRLRALAKRGESIDGPAFLPSQFAHSMPRRAYRSWRKHVARLRVARVGLAAVVHRERTGAFPADLLDLAPYFDGGVPPDPLTGGAFRLVVLADGAGFRVESEESEPDDPLAWEVAAPVGAK